MIARLLQHVRPELLRAAVVACFALTASALYLYGFKGVRNERALLRVNAATYATAPAPEALQVELDTLRSAIADQAKSLATAMSQADPGELDTWLMAELERRASAYKVRLLRVAPGAGLIDSGFHAIPIEVEARGGYFALYAWLVEIEGALPQFAVTALRVEAGSASGERLLHMTLVSHRRLDQSS